SGADAPFEAVEPRRIRREPTLGVFEPSESGVEPAGGGLQALHRLGDSRDLAAVRRGALLESGEPRLERRPGFSARALRVSSAALELLEAGGRLDAVRREALLDLARDARLRMELGRHRLLGGRRLFSAWLERGLPPGGGRVGEEDFHLLRSVEVDLGDDLE